MGGDFLNDNEIIELYWNRSEIAVKKTAEKYGNYCYTIAHNILCNPEDSDECLNDTYLNAWNAMPPHRPNMLSAFLGKITRNIALNRYKHQKRKKRCGEQMAMLLSELDECIECSNRVEDEIENALVARTISDYLYSVPKINSALFIQRYFFCNSIDDLSKRFKFSNSKITSMLYRMRGELKIILSKEGVEI